MLRSIFSSFSVKMMTVDQKIDEIKKSVSSCCVWQHENFRSAENVANIEKVASNHAKYLLVKKIIDVNVSRDREGFTDAHAQQLIAFVANYPDDKFNQLKSADHYPDGDLTIPEEKKSQPKSLMAYAVKHSDWFMFTFLLEVQEKPFDPLPTDHREYLNCLQLASMGNPVFLERMLTIKKVKEQINVTTKDTWLLQTALYVAADAGNIDCIRLLLHAGANAEVTNKSGHKPIFYSKNLPCLKLLLKNNLSDCNTDNIQLLLHYLIGEKDKIELVQYLLNEYKNAIDPKFEFAHTTFLTKAVSVNNLTVLKVLLDTLKLDINLGDQSGWTPIKCAIFLEQLACIKLLLARGAILEDAEADELYARFHEHKVDELKQILEVAPIEQRLKLAVKLYPDNQNIDEIIPLLSRSNNKSKLNALELCLNEDVHADVLCASIVESLLIYELTDEDQNQLKRLLIKAAQCGLAKSCEKLLRVVKDKETLGQALACAIANKHFYCVNKLLNSGADANGLHPHSKSPLLMTAINQKNLDCAVLLLLKGADVNCLHGDHSALMCAVANEDDNMALLLLAANADVNYQSALSLAEEKGLIEIVNIIKKHRLRTISFKKLFVPLHFIALSPQLADLLDTGILPVADFDLLNEQSLLWIAARKGNARFVNWFLTKFAGNTGAASDDQQSIYEAAVLSGNLECIKVIFDRTNKAYNPNSEEGQNLFLRAVQSGNMESIEWFIAKGAKVESKHLSVTVSDNGKTHIFKYFYTKHWAVVKEKLFEDAKSNDISLLQKLRAVSSLPYFPSHEMDENDWNKLLLIAVENDSGMFLEHLLPRLQESVYSKAVSTALRVAIQNNQEQCIRSIYVYISKYFLHDDALSVMQVAASATDTAVTSTTRKETTQKRVSSDKPTKITFKIPPSYSALYGPGDTSEAHMAGARALLNDYTKSNSAFLRFFTRHWNRHHIEEVSEIVKDIEQGRIPDTNTLITSLDNIKLVNPSGSLAKRISYIKERIGPVSIKDFTPTP